MIAARLTNDGELKVAGNVDTRLPLVTNGLVAHYPMDSTTKGIANFNVLDYSTWTIGTSGNQLGFSQNGDGNSIIEDIGPFGETQAIWQSYNNDAASDADGGWNTSSFAIDNTKKYRLSVWIKREVTGNGSTYLGCLGSSVYNIVANTVNTNPYFWSGGVSDNSWRLYVAYIYPHDIGNVYPTDDSGIYNLQKEKISSVTNFKFAPGATSTNHRSYLYYSTLPETTQKWVYPRVDLCDGTEPSVEDLLSGEGNVTNPSSNTSTTITNDYVAVEEATTNMYADGDFSTKTLHPVRNGLWSFPEYLFSPNNTQTIRLDPDGTTSYHGRDITVVSGGVYTVSCYVFMSPDCNSTNMTIRGEQAFSGAASYNLSDKGSWQRLQVTATMSSTNARMLLYELGSFTKGYILATEVQFEQKPFATEYVNGSRAVGKLTIPNPVKSGDFTVNFEAKITTAIGTTALYQTIFSMGNYNTNGSFTIMDSNGTTMQGIQRLIRKTDAAGWAWSSGDFTNAGNVNDFNMYTVVKDAVNYILYSNGVFIGQIAHGTVTMQDFVHIGSRELNRVGENSVFKNLSFYNRALSADEVKKLAKGTHSITSTGLIANSIMSQHKPPIGSNCFPLDFDGKDYYKTILPTKDENTVYEDGSVFIGDGTTNLVNQDILSWVKDSATVTLEPGTYNNQPIYKVVFASSALARIYINDIGSILGNINSSIYYKRAHLDTGTGNPQLFIRGTNFGTVFASSDSCNIQDNEWHKLDIASNIGVSTNLMYLLYINHTSHTGATIYISCPQSETTAYSTPFVNGTRAQSSLHLPYNIIDCKQDFTIYGWWYPKVYADGVYRPCLTRNIPDSNSTYNRILIMGAGTTSRNLQSWTSSNGTSESTQSTSGISVADNEWNFFCYRRLGADVILSIGNSTGITHSTNGTGEAVHLDSDGTGQVWQIGEYSNSESDAYHRDYVFYQGAMTDAEVEEVFKTKMKATKDGLYLQNGISSGIIL